MSTKLLQVETENFQKVEIVEFRPAREGATLLAGKNEQGKSSTIEAIVSTLEGAKSLPAEPIRRGQKRSKTKLTLGDETIDFIVTQELTETGRKLTVTDAAGVKQSSPQDILNKLLNRVAMDPLAFARDTPENQDATLKEICGVADDFAKLDAEAKVIYDKRHGINQQAKQAEARAAAMPLHPKAPLAEVSVAELAKQIDAAKDHARARTNAEEAITRQEGDVARAQAEVEKLKAQLVAAETTWAAQNSKRNALVLELEGMAPNTDTTELQAKLETAEATNKLVRENAARKEEEKRAEKLKGESQELTDKLADIDAQKQALLAAAKFPVEGLGFNDLGPTLNGVPLAQASTARKLDLSYAVAVALNPKLKLLIIREGAFFDEESLAAIDERARRDGVQVLIERVGTRDKGSNVVIIENGLVKADSTAAE